MSEMTAFCGLDCSRCPSFLATQNDDDRARAATAAMLKKRYGLNLRPDEINCDGCRSTAGRRLSYCRTCAVRACAMDREVETCAACPDQPCEKLQAFHAFSPEAKACFGALLK